MYFRHDSFDLKFREPFGAVPIGSRVTLRVEAHDVMNIRLRTYYRKSERFFDMLPTDQPDTFAVSITLPNHAGLFWYDFQFNAYNQSYTYGTQNDTMGGEGQIYEEYPPSFQITLYDNSHEVPDWYTDGIMYQIFPDRFAKGSTYQGTYHPRSMVHGNWNDPPHYFRQGDGSIGFWDFFGGNLEGIIEKLDYLKTLNVTILYLNPIFESMSNHKYDTADYSKIAPEFGDEALFKKLCSEAKKRGMRIILDGVFSHTGDDSVYFNRYGHYPGTGAYQSKSSPFFNWYRFSRYPDEYESWWGIKSMPNVEELTPSFQDYIFRNDDSIIRKWVRAGASGWRLDVADELPDAFIAGLKEALIDEKEDSVLIGEVWEDASNKVSYDVHRKYFMGHELDAVMNYPFRESVLNFFTGETRSRDLSRKMMSLYENYPRKQFMGNLNLIGSHDRTRVLTVLGGASGFNMSEEAKENFVLSDYQYKLAKKRLKMVSLLQMTFPGVPCIYYGDEAGCQGFEDPFNRGTYPWDKEDKELLSWYRTITKLRVDNPPLVKGRWYPLSAMDDLFVYLRVHQSQAILCLFNRSTSDYMTYHHKMFENESGEDLLTHRIETLSGITINPLSAKVIKVLTNSRLLLKKFDF